MVIGELIVNELLIRTSVVYGGFQFANKTNAYIHLLTTFWTVEKG